MLIDTVAQERAKFLQFLFLHGHKLTDDERTLLNNAWERALFLCPQGSQLKYVIEEAYELITEVEDVGPHYVRLGIPAVQRVDSGASA